MDDKFFEDLDNALTGVGTDTVWKRRIGGHEFWFSPINYESRIKINDTLQNAELGSIMLAETKRITLSFAICGFDNNDFTQYRNSGHQFQVPDRARPGNFKKVNFSDWLYEKILGWDDQLIMDCFSVYADLMETHQANNLKEVKFENLQSPYEEMLELMGKIAEVRDRLGLPHLVDPATSDDFDERPFPEPKNTRTDKAIEEPTNSPFEPIHKDQQDSMRSLNQAKTEIKKTEEPVLGNPGADILQETSPKKPFVPQQDDDVIDTPTFKPTTKPIIDSPPLNLNPRFAHPKRS